MEVLMGWKWGAIAEAAMIRSTKTLQFHDDALVTAAYPGVSLAYGMGA